MKKSGDSLVPADSEAASRLHGLSRDGLVMVGVRQPRNPRQHRLIWGLARLVHENTDGFTDAAHVIEQCKIGTGYVDRIRLVIPELGEVEQIRGKSIAFESMAQDDADEFLQRMLDYIASDLMPGVDPVAMLAEARAGT